MGMNDLLRNTYKAVRKEHGANVRQSYLHAKSIIKTKSFGLDSYPYHYEKGEEIELEGLPEGCSIVLKVENESWGERPWEWCEGWGTVEPMQRYAEYPGNGNIQLRSYGRENYYYNFAEALAKARKEFSGTKYGKSYADRLALESVQREMKFFEGYINDDWYYVWVSVKAYRDGEEIYDESCGMYESTHWQDGAVELIDGAERAIYASAYAGATVGAL
jgi:hypothetical protein